MRILNRKQFLALPAETLYSRYSPCIFGQLEIKGDNCGDNDWFYQQIADAIACGSSTHFAQLLEEARMDGRSLEMELGCEDRDGCYKEGELFAVWEEKDVRQLIDRLKECLKTN